jgi:hypothetical protein
VSFPYAIKRFVSPYSGDDCFGVHNVRKDGQPGLLLWGSHIDEAQNCFSGHVQELLDMLDENHFILVHCESTGKPMEFRVLSVRVCPCQSA